MSLNLLGWSECKGEGPAPVAYQVDTYIANGLIVKQTVGSVDTNGGITIIAFSETPKLSNLEGGDHHFHLVLKREHLFDRNIGKTRRNLLHTSIEKQLKPDYVDI